MTGSRPVQRARRLGSLSEAQAVPDAIVELVADWGGNFLVVARVASIRCDEEELWALLSDLDALVWRGNNLQGSWLTFLEGPVGRRVRPMTDGVSCHPVLVQAGAEAGVRRVLAGECRRLPTPEPAIEPHERAAIVAAYHGRSPAYGIAFGWGWPEHISSLQEDEVRRLQDEEIPPRADGQRWKSPTLRAVGSQAGLEPWVSRYRGADDRWDDPGPDLTSTPPEAADEVRPDLES